MLEPSVNDFCATIGFRVKCSGHMGFDAEAFTQALPEFGGKLRASISDEGVRQTTNSPNAIDEGSYDRENIEISERDKAFKFYELIDYHHNVAVDAAFVRTWRQCHNEIHREIRPEPFRDRKRV